MSNLSVQSTYEKLDIIEELIEDVRKDAWILGINDTDLLALLTKIFAEGLDSDKILAELDRE